MRGRNRIVVSRRYREWPRGGAPYVGLSVETIPQDPGCVRVCIIRRQAWEGI